MRRRQAQHVPLVAAWLNELCAARGYGARERRVLVWLAIHARWPSYTLANFSLTSAADDLGFGDRSGRRTLSAILDRLAVDGLVQWDGGRNGEISGWVAFTGWRAIVRDAEGAGPGEGPAWWQFLPRRLEQLRGDELWLAVELAMVTDPETRTVRAGRRRLATYLRVGVEELARRLEALEERGIVKGAGAGEDLYYAALDDVLTGTVPAPVALRRPPTRRRHVPAGGHPQAPVRPGSGGALERAGEGEGVRWIARVGALDRAGGCAESRGSPGISTPVEVVDPQTPLSTSRVHSLGPDHPEPDGGTDDDQPPEEPPPPAAHAQPEPEDRLGAVFDELGARFEALARARGDGGQRAAQRFRRELADPRRRAGVAELSDDARAHLEAGWSPSELAAAYTHDPPRGGVHSPLAWLLRCRAGDLGPPPRRALLGLVDEHRLPPQRGPRRDCPACEGRGWREVDDGGRGTVERCDCADRELVDAGTADPTQGV